jgi:hypothetical protein
MEAGPEVNTEETMFSCLITRIQDRHSVLIPNKFKYWGITMTNQNYIYEDI